MSTTRADLEKLKRELDELPKVFMVSKAASVVAQVTEEFKYGSYLGKENASIVIDLPLDAKTSDCGLNEEDKLFVMQILRHLRLWNENKIDKGELIAFCDTCSDRVNYPNNGLKPERVEDEAFQS